MLRFNVMRGLRPSVNTIFVRNIQIKAPLCGKSSCLTRWGGLFLLRWPLVRKPSSKVQFRYTQPRCLLSRYLSTSASLPSESGKLIYTGSLCKAIIGVKMFSYTSSACSLCLMPHILFKTGLATQGLAAQAFFLTVVGCFTFVTPVLLHLFTKGYVVRLFYDTETDSYTAVTYSALLMERRTAFGQAEVSVPAVSKIFTSFYAGKVGLMVNPDLFQLPSDYNHLMGYDRPFSFNTDDLERPDKS